MSRAQAIGTAIFVVAVLVAVLAFRAEPICPADGWVVGDGEVRCLQVIDGVLVHSQPEWRLR
jgi:hypothetical protein